MHIHVYSLCLCRGVFGKVKNLKIGHGLRMMIIGLMVEPIR